MTTNYVIGYFFSPDMDRVLLILKNRPEHLKGMWNGIGGAVKPKETYPAAMTREFEEETGIKIPIERWDNFLSITVYPPFSKITYIMECFKCIAKDEEEFMFFKTNTDELVRDAKIDTILNHNLLKLVPNQKWIIPIALDNQCMKSNVIYVRSE